MYVRRLLTWREAMEEKRLSVNAGKMKIMIFGGVSLDRLRCSSKFPCALCNTGVGSNIIFCNGCQFLVHKECSGLKHFTEDSDYRMFSPLLFLGSLLLLNCGTLAANFSPNGTSKWRMPVTVRSCTSHCVVVRLDNASDGGLIYIQGRSSACKRTTSSALKDYKFDFDLCNIKYDTKFRVIVQRNPFYQTGYDKVIPVMCLVDTSDLKVSSQIYPEEVLDAWVNKTIRPTVRMRMLSMSRDISGGEITLDDTVRMSLALDDPYTADFDIKAKDCTAALIPLVKDECSSDEELFPNFEHKSQGHIASTFHAFQPTNLHGEPEVDVAFTCNVVVCKGACHKTKCGETLGWGKKKRNTEEDEIVENVTVGTTLRVKTPQTEAQNEEEAAQADYCADKYIVTSISVVTVITLVFSWVICGCVYSKLKRLGKDKEQSAKTKRRLSERSMSIARVVGRRLSSILQLPTGYNVRGPSKMDSIPEFEPTPPSKRRESVHVSTNIDDVISNTCRLRSTKAYQDSCTQTSVEDSKLSSNKDLKSHTSNINYYYKKKLEKKCSSRSNLISVESSESEPFPDYEDSNETNYSATTSALSKNAYDHKAENKSTHKGHMVNARDQRTASYSSAPLEQKASFDIISDNEHETKYRSVLNISKHEYDTNKETLADDDIGKSQADFSKRDELGTQIYHTISPANTSDEYSAPKKENGSDEYRPLDDTSAYQNKAYSGARKPCASVVDNEQNSGTTNGSGQSLTSVLRNRNESISSVSTSITVSDDVMDDDIFIPEADYEPIYEAVAIGAQLLARGESINSTHV